MKFCVRYRDGQGLLLRLIFGKQSIKALILPDLRSGAHLFDKRILIEEGKGAGYPDGLQDQLPNHFCVNIVATANMRTLLVC